MMKDSFYDFFATLEILLAKAKELQVARFSGILFVFLTLTCTTTAQYISIGSSLNFP